MKRTRFSNDPDNILVLMRNRNSPVPVLLIFKSNTIRMNIVITDDHDDRIKLIKK